MPNAVIIWLESIIEALLSGAASLSYLFHCTSPAPHGGFLALPVIGNAVPWALSIVAASVLARIALGYLKKTQTLKARA